MGTITRSLANNITTSGVILPTGITNASVANVTSFANAADPSTLILLSTQTASASASIEFTSGIDSTYDEYIFKFIDIHPETDDKRFTFNISSDGGSNYNVIKTTTVFEARHHEDGVTSGLAYSGRTLSEDLAQSTGFQYLSNGQGNGNDENLAGTLTLYNPSNTTFVKHFIAETQWSRYDNASYRWFIAGYGNTTSAINAIQFKMISGNIDEGIIKMYGVKKS